MFNLLRRIPFLRIFSKMEIDSQDLSYSHELLNSFIIQKGSGGNEDIAVKEYLDQIKYPPIQDFKEGLEWFNVSEPLSFSKHLKGKVVVLDFFTYCCINCMHIIPELREIENEFSVEDGLVVIGVHSAKFENEKLSSNILAAVQRYNIGHPVVNDNKSEMWQNCGIHCWPTLLMVGPNANPIVMLMGEGHKENLRLYIRNALEFYKSKKQISNHSLPFKSAYHLLPNLKGPLLFPGKITNYFDKDTNTEILAVSDSGNHRILIISNKGVLKEQIGGNGVGFKDGLLSEAQFNSPQGVAFQNRDTLFVADTENHAIRKVNLKAKTVITVAGTGSQGNDRLGGKIGVQQEISSPWDVCIYSTPDLDMSFHATVDETPLKDVLLIAMAGTHQIWALFLEDIIWWKFKKYPAGTCVCIAGSGREENRNNQYPHAAAFAQPSGLALCTKNKEVYIADSESSSVRRLSLLDGKVSAVVGGDRNPNNLFAFGDKDGNLTEGKLQHLLGLSIYEPENILFVADTYNHKVKKVDISKNYVSTLTGSGLDTVDGKTRTFEEPGGLCVSADGKKLYVADTNNHCIKVVDLNKEFLARGVHKLDLNLNQSHSSKDRSNYFVVSANTVDISNKGGKLILQVNIMFEDSLKLTDGAIQKWYVDVPSASWSCVPNTSSNIKDVDVVVSVPPSKAEETSTLDFIFDLLCCTKDTCLPKNFVLKQPITYHKTGPTEAKLLHKVSLNLTSVNIA